VNSVDIRRLISPSADEVQAACAAFGELPKPDILPRLVMVRRAVAAGYYTDNLRILLTTDKSNVRRPASEP
jgi:hypothetical protein